MAGSLSGWSTPPADKSSIITQCRGFARVSTLTHDRVLVALLATFRWLRTAKGDSRDHKQGQPRGPEQGGRPNHEALLAAHDTVLLSTHAEHSGGRDGVGDHG